MSLSSTEQRRLVTIMFTDMVGYTALSQRDESLAIELLDEHRQLLRSVFQAFNGREVETVGDAFLIEFRSALDAVRCSLEIQGLLHTRNLKVPAARRIEVRIGLHVGDVMCRDGKVLGDAVNLASRVHSLAEPGGVCLTQQVRDQVGDRVDVPLIRLGHGELKNVEVPVCLYRMMLPWKKRGHLFIDRWSFQFRQRWVRAIATVWAAILVLAALLLWQSRMALHTPGGLQRAAPFSPPEMTRLLVLPVVDYSTDGGRDYFADGITELLTSGLAKIAQLQVVSRTSAMQYKKQPKDIRVIATEQGVGSILEGSVRVTTNQVRITTRLINAATGLYVWAHDYNCEIQDVLSAQREIAIAVARTLGVQLLAKDLAELAKLPTDRPEAFQLYLQGRFHWAKGTKAGFEQAVDCFLRAIQLDPQYALAHAGLADTYVSAADWYLPAREVMPKAYATAAEAIRYDSTLAEAHLSLGKVLWLYKWDPEAAKIEYEQACALGPRDAMVRNEYANFLLSAGHADAAREQRRQAQALDPHSLVIKTSAGFDLYEAGRYDAAIAQAREILRIDPNHIGAHNLVVQAQAQKQLYPAALEELEKSRALDDGPDLMALQACLCARNGQTNQARQLLTQIEDLATNRFVSAYLKAVVHNGLGETNQAFAFLRQAVDERSTFLVGLSNSPLWKPYVETAHWNEFLSYLKASQP